MHTKSIPVLTLVVALAACGNDSTHRTRLVLAATTSIEDSGLLDTLVARFAGEHPGIQISAVAVGTGQALELARRGDADVLISHDSAAEAELVRQGIARHRENVMYNYFVVAGPPEDPARIKAADALTSFRAIATSASAFVSRGDDSGTHRRELSLWQRLGIDPRAMASYIEAGVGMGDALLLAGQKRAYILTDLATFLRFKPRINLEILSVDPLPNLYGVTVLEGARAQAAEAFAEWITGASAQQLIGDFGRAEFGQPLFTPAAVAEAAGQRNS